MKRPLTVLAAGFVLGEVLALQALRSVDMGILPWLSAAAAGFLWLCAAAVGFLRRRMGIKPYRRTVRDNMQGSRTREIRGLLLFLACLMAGCCLGSGRGGREKAILDREEAVAGGLAGARIKVRGRIGRMDEKEGAVTLTLDDATAYAGLRTMVFRRVLVYVEREGEDPKGQAGAGPVHDHLAVGMNVSVKGSMEPVEGPRNPGEFDFKMYYRTKGTACRMFAESLEPAGGEGVPYDGALEAFRAWCAGVLERICVPGDAAIFKAVLLGDSSSMDPQVRHMYQRHGISHLLAVSGQHLSIIGGGIYLMLRRGGLGYGKAGGVSAFLVISYGVLTGSSGSAVRAVIMILCLWMAAVRGRSYDTMSALGLAALVLLYREPYLLYHSGFQLSFGAVLAIGGLGSWIRPALGLAHPWAETLLISLCVQIVITPVVLYHYYQYPLYGIFLNLLVIPLISILMYSGILGIAVGSFWLRGGMAAVGAGHYILRFYEWLCGQAERLPGYCLIMGRPAWIQMGLYVLGMAGALRGIKWLGDRGNRTDLSVPSQRDAAGEKHKAPIRVLLCPVLLACSYVLCFLVLLPLPVKGLEMVCLDVGQGDGLLLLTREYTVMVDGGSSSQKNLGSRTLEPYLTSRGITRIDYAVVSHGDSDHISGLTYLLSESRDIEIGKVLLPVMGKGEDIYQNLEDMAAARGSQVIYMGESGLVKAGDLTLTCLYGGEDFPGKDRNSHSLVLCGDYGGFHMLFTGDTGEAQERRLLELAEVRGSIQDTHLNHVQVLKTAHHGSQTSSSEDFLDRMKIKLALISYGRGNTYGHPSPEVLERLDGRGIPVLETGKAGALTLHTDGSRLWIHTFLQEDPSLRKP